jgi:DNA-binding MarR family transcriptional regulator
MAVTHDSLDGGDCGGSRLVEQLVELAKRIRQRLDERCEAEGISASRIAVLQAMIRVGDEGCSQTELAALLRLSESNICSLIERMRSSGLLFRFRSKTDRRKSVLILSGRGNQLAHAVSRAQNLEAALLVSALRADQQAALRDLLQLLRDHLDASPPIVAPVEGDDADRPGVNGSQLKTTAAEHSAERFPRRAS